MIKVCHVSTVHPAFDGRIFDKQCISLVNAGFDVSLVIPYNKNETIEGVKIVGLKRFSNRILRISIAPIFAFFKVLGTRAKIVEFHDPELMFLGVILKILGKKVIFDSHENVSSQIEDKPWIRLRFIRVIVKSVYRLVEKTCIFFYDKVISVTPEIVSFLAPKKGLLLRNYPLVKHVTTSNNLRENKHLTRFIYVGGLTQLRGVSEICKAFSRLENDCELILAGQWESEEFANECLANSTRIIYKGVLKLNEVYELISSADVGLATLYHQKNYLNSLPVKSFEYMANGLPLIMSDIPYWKIHYANFAKFVNPQNIDEIANAMQWMLDHPEKRSELGDMGRKAVLEKYSWEIESKKLLNMYKELSN